MPAQNRRSARRRRTAAATVAWAGLAFASQAMADAGVDLRSFRPSTDRSGSLATEDVNTPGHGKLQFAQWLGFSTTALEIREPNAGSPEKNRVLGPQLLLDPTVALGLGSRVAVGLSLPFVAAQSTQPSATLTGGAAVASQALGDLTFTGKVAILAPDTTALTRLGLAALVRFSLPTGDRSSFISDSGVVAETRALMLYEYARTLGLYGVLGYRMRMAHHDLADLRVGDSIPWGATLALHPQALGLDKNRHWTWALEAHGEVGTSAFFTDARVSPALVGLSARYELDPSWSLFAGVETGVSSALGTPRFRGVLSVSYAPTILDEDHDGVPDAQDECPGLEEDGVGKKPRDGCPDIEDEPVKEPPPPPPDPGPPPPPAPTDTDGDGIPDDFDKCPDQAETVNGFEDEDGCPELDRDGDTIFDAIDKCPDEPETWNGFEDEDGCPEPKDAGPPPLKKGGKIVPAKPLIVEESGGLVLARPLAFVDDEIGKDSVADLRAIGAWLLVHPTSRVRVAVRPEPTPKGAAPEKATAQAAARTKGVVETIVRVAHTGGVAVAGTWDSKDKSKGNVQVTVEPKPPPAPPVVVPAPPPAPAPAPPPAPAPAPAPTPSTAPPAPPSGPPPKAPQEPKKSG